MRVGAAARILHALCSLGIRISSSERAGLTNPDPERARASHATNTTPAGSRTRNPRLRYLSSTIELRGRVSEATKAYQADVAPQQGMGGPPVLHRRLWLTRPVS